MGVAVKFTFPVNSYTSCSAVGFAEVVKEGVGLEDTTAEPEGFGAIGSGPGVDNTL